jgi:N-dimethylarginine dimethylaminohydrolase
VKLHIRDEFSALKKVAVCYGTAIPEFEKYHPTDPAEKKWGWKNWDKQLLLKQQAHFFKQLQKYQVEVIELETAPELEQQMYVRDVAFVLNDTLFFAAKRTLKVRNGEIEKLLSKLQLLDSQIQSLPGKVEGGDVLAGEEVFVGISDRTNKTAIAALQKHAQLRPLFVGKNIMHLDTCLTVLPNKYCLVYLPAFAKNDQEYLSQHYKLIPITAAEKAILGTNVFIVNPETIFVESRHKRIQSELKKAGFKVETIDYTEPIVLGGSFRCTTLPLVRE